jgi:hypothetical protein
MKPNENDLYMDVDKPESLYAEINQEISKLENTHEENNMNVDDVLMETGQEDYYMWMLQKVMSSIPDVLIDPEFKREPSSDGESVNDYTNKTTFKYFNSFD